MQADLPSVPTVRDVAARVNLSVYHFSRLFRQDVGITPHRYMTMLRIERARLLLRTTDYKVQRIAREVGLKSEANFIHLFQRKTGCSPTAFRKNGTVSGRKNDFQ